MLKFKLGCYNGFVPVEENGSRLLTIQFLCTLREVDDGVSFWLFGVERYFNWRNFSHLLGFSARLPISLAKACRGFDRHEFWGLISGQVTTWQVCTSVQWHSKSDSSFDAQVGGYHSLSKRWSTTSAERWVDYIICHSQQDSNLPRKSNG